MDEAQAEKAVQSVFTESGIIDKAKQKVADKLTKSGVAGSPWHVDFKTGIKLLKNPDTWKVQSKKEEASDKMRVAAVNRSYDAVKLSVTKDRTTAS